MPSIIEPTGPAAPAAGVTATSPATAPDAPPSIDGLPDTSRSAAIQVSNPAAGATSVLTIATAASPFASSAEPALKPNQPTHSSPAPTIVSASECGHGEIADELPAAVEGQAIVPQHPGQDRDRGDAEHLAHHAEQVLSPDEAAVKQGQARQDHQHHERGRRQHPCRVAAVDRESG